MRTNLTSAPNRNRLDSDYGQQNRRRTANVTTKMPRRAKYRLQLSTGPIKVHTHIQRFGFGGGGDVEPSRIYIFHMAIVLGWLCGNIWFFTAFPSRLRGLGPQAIGSLQLWSWTRANRHAIYHSIPSHTIPSHRIHHIPYQNWAACGCS